MTQKAATLILHLMRTDVAPAEVEHYREHGFVVIEDLLDAEELDLWRATITESVESRLASSGQATKMHERLGGDSEEVPAERKAYLEYYEQVFTQQVNLWKSDDGARKLVLDERLGWLAADLTGVDGIRLYHDQALFKPAWGNPTAFHLDLPYWSFTSPEALSIWIALDDSTVENGCLYFVPGSHVAQAFDGNVAIGQQLGALFEQHPEWAGIDPVPCPLRAGSASFHNGLTAHGAGANMTSRARRAMTLQLMPHGASYNGVPNIFPPDVVATLSVGDVLDDDTLNPLLWTKDLL